MVGYTPRGSGTQRPLTPEEQKANKKAVEGTLASQRAVNGGTPGPTYSPPDDRANFTVSDAAKKTYQGALNDAAELGAKSDVYGMWGAEQRATNAIADDQASRGGVEVADALAPAGGLVGFLDPNAKTTTKHFTARNVQDTTTAGNKALIGARVAGLDNRQSQTMQAAQLDPAAQATAANIATDPQAQFRAQQMGLAGVLGNAAAGTGGPTAAEALLKRSTDRNMAQALGLALAARGGNQVSALKQAGMQRALISQDASGQAAALRAQEQQQAQQALGNVLASGRGADIGLATDQAQLTQQAALANQSAANQMAIQQGQLTQDAAKTNLAAGIDQQKQKDDLTQKYLAMGFSLDQAKQQAELQQAQFNAQLLAQQAAADKGVAMQSSAAGGQAAAAGAAAFGTILAGVGTAVSDKRAKTDIKPAKDSALREFFGSVGAHSYRYKNPKKPLRGEGRHVSPMAQELESTELGKALVKDTPDGKVVDYGKGLGLMLAGMSWMNKKLDKLEAARA